MKITIESTETITTLVTPTGEVPARLWQGRTESGTPVHCFITRISPTIPKDDPRNQEFARELKDCVKPRAEIGPIPLRLIL